MNIDPYGLDAAEPVTRLQEALQIIRLCLLAPGPITFCGKHYRLEVRPDGSETRARKSAGDLDRGTYRRRIYRGLVARSVGVRCHLRIDLPELSAARLQRRRFGCLLDRHGGRAVFS